MSGTLSCAPHLQKEWLRHYLTWLSPFRGRDYLRTRNRRIVTAPDRVLSSGSRSIRVRPGGERKRMSSPSRTGRTYTRISSTNPPQALTGHVGAEDFEVLAARGAQCRGDGFPDITGEERDRRVRRVRRDVGEDELSSPVVGRGVRAVGHTLTHLVGPPADEHGAGGRHDLRKRALDRRHEVEDPVHRVAGSSGEPVE